jgi:hypothetical protein
MPSAGMSLDAGEGSAQLIFFFMENFRAVL